MNYSITTLGKKTIAGFHLVGPWDHTVKQGFEQLMMWVDNHQVPARARVVDYDFATPWMQFFDSLQQSTAYRIAPQPCQAGV